MLTRPKEFRLDIGLRVARNLVDLLDGTFLQVKEGQKQSLVRRQLLQSMELKLKKLRGITAARLIIKHHSSDCSKAL